VVIVGFPRSEAGRGRFEAVEAWASPEFLLIDPMATFDLAVVLRNSCPLSHCSLRIRNGTLGGARL